MRADTEEEGMKIKCSRDFSFKTPILHSTFSSLSLGNLIANQTDRYKALSGKKSNLFLMETET